MNLDKMQDRVAIWMGAVFPRAVIKDERERAYRFCEESLELVQAMGVPKGEAAAILDYVYARDVGEAAEEAGDVLITLSALANTKRIDLTKAFLLRQNRNWKIKDQIRAKHDSKPIGLRTPLPGEVDE